MAYQSSLSPNIITCCCFCHFKHAAVETWKLLLIFIFLEVKRMRKTINIKDKRKKEKSESGEWQRGQRILCFSQFDLMMAAPKERAFLGVFSLSVNHNLSLFKNSFSSLFVFLSLFLLSCILSSVELMICSHSEKPHWFLTILHKGKRNMGPTYPTAHHTMSLHRE